MNVRNLGKYLTFNVRNLRLYLRSGANYPLVTVVVPLYNEERFVIETLKSVSRQSYKNWECIIVNDVSTDNSRQIAQDYIKYDSRFRIIDHKVNSGLAASRNTGLKNARGAFITFLDSDDFLFKHSLWTRVVELFKYKKDERIAGVFCSIMATPQKPNKLRLFAHTTIPSFRPSADFISARGECPFNVLAPMLKTEIIQRFCGFDESMKRGAEDWDLWLRLLRHGYIFLHSGSLGGGYRQKERSMVRSMPHYHVREALALTEKAYSELQEKDIVEGAPFVFRHALSYYQHLITINRRLVQFATLAYLAGNMKGFEEIIQYMTPETSYYLTRHVNFSHLMDIAFNRFHCVGRCAPKTTSSGWPEQKKEILKRIMARIS